MGLIMLEVLQQTGTTTYAPIRTTIDGDRDYLRGDRQHFPGDVSHLSGLGRCNCGYQGLDGTYQDGVLPQGMLGEALERWDSKDVVGLAVIAGGAYGGYTLSEGAATGGRVAATVGGLMAGIIVAFFIDPPFG